MSKNTSVVLGKEQASFIRTQIRKGRFGSASEAVRAGLRLLEEQELKLERLRAALAEGEASGAPATFDMDRYIAEKRRAERQAEEDPFAVFTEWPGEADEKVYGKL